MILAVCLKYNIIPDVIEPCAIWTGRMYWDEGKKAFSLYCSVKNWLAVPIYRTCAPTARRRDLREIRSDNNGFSIMILFSANGF